MSKSIDLSLSREDFSTVVDALYAAGEDAASQAVEDRKWDEETADEMQAAADRYTDLANRLSSLREEVKP